MALAREATGSAEDLVEHGGGDAAGKGVLLARVVAAKEQHVGPVLAPEQRLDAVPEGRAGPWDRIASLDEYRPERLPGESAEADDDPHGRSHHSQLRAQPGDARVPFLRRRLVFRRRAAHYGGHPRADQPLAVAGGDAVGPGGEAAAVERGEDEVAAAVAGEDPPGPVAAVRGRRQADDENGRFRVSPAGDGTAPVLLGPEGLAAGDRHLLPPLDQPGAGPADRLPRDQLGQRPRVARELSDLRSGGRDGRARVRRILRPAGTRRHECRHRVVVRPGTVSHSRSICGHS